jgi:hypothetical protein
MMSSFDDLTTRLKEEQDRLDAIRKAHWPAFASFRDGLIEGLTTFTVEAAKADLRDVKEPAIEERANGLLDVAITLNGLDLRLVAPSEFLLDPSKMELLRDGSEEARWNALMALSPSFRIYVFTNVDGQSTPYAYIQVACPGEQIGPYNLWLYRSDHGLFLIDGGNQVNSESGRQLARRLIEHAYSVKHLWKQRPTLEALHRSSGGRKIGFPGAE